MIVVSFYVLNECMKENMVDLLRSIFKLKQCNENLPVGRGEGSSAPTLISC